VKHRLAGALESLSSAGDGDLKSSDANGDNCQPEEQEDRPAAASDQVPKPQDTPLSAVSVLMDSVDQRCSDDGHKDTLIRVTDESSYCTGADDRCQCGGCNASTSSNMQRPMSLH